MFLLIETGNENYSFHFYKEGLLQSDKKRENQIWISLRLRLRAPALLLHDLRLP